MQNQIPKNWSKVRLGENALLNPTVTLGKGSFPYIPMEDLDWNKKYVTEKEIKEFKGGTKFAEGDILFARITPCLENGKIGRVKNLRDGKGFGSTEYFIIRGKDGVTDTDFLYYLCRTNNLRQTAKNSMVGASGRQRANIESLENYEVYLPDFITQKKIASVLSAFDNKIEVNNKIAKTLEEMAQAIYKEWFVHFRFPGYEKVKMIDFPLGKIPEGWEIKDLGEVSINYDSKRKPLSSLKRAEMQGEYPYYGAAKVLDYIDGYIFDGKYLLIAEDGSVITKDNKPVLQFVNEKFWPNNHTHVIQGNGKVSTEFLYTFLSNYDISGHITGAAQPKITQENLNRIKILIPSDYLLAQFNKLLIDLNSLVNSLDRENKCLRKTRDLLLSKLMRGEIRI